jgi:hypothetical protein
MKAKAPLLRAVIATAVAASLVAGLFVTSAVAASARPARAASLDRPLAAACVPGRRACPIPITFERGAYSAQRSSRLTGITAERWFAVRARAGQTMVVVVEGAGPTRGIVYFPNGHHEGQPGGRVFDDVLPVSGVYRIRVNESTMAEAWSGRVTVVVLIY